MATRKISNGDRFGVLIVVGAYAKIGKKRHWYHQCRCECGRIDLCNISFLRDHESDSCLHDLKVNIGDKYGRLLVKGNVGIPEGKHCFYYECLCDCGNKKEVSGVLLKKGEVKSCGCLKKESSSKAHTVHGMEATRLYRIWRNMKTRCLNSENSHYKWYGLRGIKVCEDWMDFEPFMHWAFANGYKSSLTIDRIDNDGNYCPENCRWISQAENSRKQKADRVLRARQLAGAL